MVADAIDFLLTHLWSPRMLILLTVLPSALFWMWRASRHRQQALARFAGLRQAIHHLRYDGMGPGLLTVLGLLAICLGSAGPLWGKNPQTTPITVRDLWILLDLSRSMLAEDHPPLSRIERAQREIRGLLSVLRQNPGYRVGLIVFAGKAKVACPLTDDYEHFDHALTLARPELLDLRLRLQEDQTGDAIGTSIANALSLVGGLIDSNLAGFQDVLLVSDGDDLAGGWQLAAAQLARSRVKIHCIGIGDPNHEAFIPTGRPEQPYFLVADGGAKATTRRHDEVLGAIAQEGGGATLMENAVGQPTLDWAATQLLRAPRYTWEGDRRLLAAHQYGWFFAVGLLCWTLAWLWAIVRRLSARTTLA